MRSDVVIIGGGAAGLFAAAKLAENGIETVIIEPNRVLGRKLRITGKGRCNVTNNCTSDEVIKNITSNPKFMYSALSKLSPADVMEWFESRGVPLKTERGGRVFPASDKASDIAEALERAVKSRRCRIVKDKAEKLLSDGERITGVKCKDGEYFADYVILATGGASYPGTGSTGDGYKMAEELGHTVAEIKPSLVPIILKERLYPDVIGLALKNIRLSLYRPKKKSPVFSEIGELTFTEYGISGPLALSASCYIDGDEMRNGLYKIVIDLKPGLTDEQLLKRIQRDFDEAPTKELKDAMPKLLPFGIIPDVVFRTGIAPKKQCGQITKSEREALCAVLKRFCVTPVDLRPIDEAIITDGGVSVKEISPLTMESKLIKGLYFAGEIIDCAAMTGGYNLQIAFSTANAAATAILSEISLREDN